jgi:hypothetical protein
MRTVGQTVLGGQYVIVQELPLAQGWLCVSSEGGREVVIVSRQEELDYVQAIFAEAQQELDFDTVLV